MSNPPVPGRRLIGLALSISFVFLSLGVASAAADVNGEAAALEAKLDVLQPSVDALEAKADALESKLDVIESKLDEPAADLSEIQATLDRIETEIIDNACLANERKPSLYLPPPAGGQLPTVRQRAIQVINAVTLSGETTNNAMSKITLGDFYLNAQMWKKAYSTYCQALCLAVSLPGETPRCLAPPF